MKVLSPNQVMKTMECEESIHRQGKGERRKSDFTLYIQSIHIIVIHTHKTFPIDFGFRVQIRTRGRNMIIYILHQHQHPAPLTTSFLLNITQTPDARLHTCSSTNSFMNIVFCIGREREKQERTFSYAPTQSTWTKQHNSLLYIKRE